MNEQIEETVRAAMKRAYNLGQTYWQQADSEYTSHHKKADVTQGRFIELNDETCAAVAAAIASQAPRQALTDADIAAIYKRTFERMPGCARIAPTAAPLVIEFGHAVAAASGPNAALVAAFRELIECMEHEVTSKHRALEAARAALAAVGLEP